MSYLGEYPLQPMKYEMDLLLSFLFFSRITGFFVPLYIRNMPIFKRRLKIDETLWICPYGATTKTNHLHPLQKVILTVIL